MALTISSGGEVPVIVGLVLATTSGGNIQGNARKAAERLSRGPGKPAGAAASALTGCCTQPATAGKWWSV